MARIQQENQNLSLQLDFSRYGLSSLKDTPVYQWRDSDVDKLIEAFASENIAPALYGLAFTPERVKGLLSLSHCCRCGKCCLPNPVKPEHPGVSVSEQDIIRISENSQYTYKHLKKRAPVSRDPNFVRGRYLPLPCMFYDEEEGRCRIYNFRPLICRTFPLTDIPGRTGIAVNVRCEYGRDIYKTVLGHLRRRTGAREG